MSSIKLISASVLVFFCCRYAEAQAPSDFELLKKKYPGEKAVILNDQEDILIEVENNRYKITENILKETYIIQSAGSAFTEDEVYTSHFHKIIGIDAKTLVPEGNKYREKRVEKFIDKKSSSDNIFYDEVIAKSFVFPSVQPGAITSLKFSRELTCPSMLGSFFFKWHLPCEVSKISIKADKRAKLKFKLFNVDPSYLDFKHQDKGRYNIYTWTAKNIKASPYESDAPDIRYYYPHVAYYIENYNPVDTANLQFKGLNGLYSYYHGLVKDVNKQDDPKITEEVNKIVAGATTDDDKVKRIFYWVQENINYIAFEEGMQGLIPEDASLVYNKRYGDCKGMSSLIHNMLKVAGVKSHLTWIGTRHLPYNYTDIPSQLVDNHMIVTYYSNGKPIFLDGTNNYLPLGIPSAMIQGKEALVGIDDKNYKVEKVPVIEASQNMYCDSSSFTLRNRSVEGTGILSLNGYEKIYRTYYLAGKDNEKKKEHLLSITSKGNNKYFLDTFNIENLTNRELPLLIGYKFRLNDYFREIDDEIYLNMNLNKPYANGTYDPSKHLVPVENKYSSSRKLVSVFEIPEGYKITFLPKDKSSGFEKLSFSIHYKVDGNRVIQTKEIHENYLILEPSEFKKWNEVIESLNQAYRDVLILKKI